mmetsp:Transcript_27568/g.57690  ORF Transcript_27568/g.57690 Transcript_27568/m.57690 type:complete len:274 (-) Transcript_27568:128-949(-)|eukprot:CAMPEP_0172449670 /NCGR_PEP_ID=MMETSP1065-20121228/8319_1 /TAXON_ID=265537 /ORGANISM="Amphiprora paludosa, Strain CCMP125" /LENGTH=273 /DNA_ID=CAMNT_0013201391 /DNA_START=49 /DNA_END=870 /DNA_ORIENTATION=+
MSTTEEQQQQEDENQVQEQETTPRRRSIVFSDQPHTEIYIEQIEELDAEALWWTPDDYFEIKAQSRLDAKEWRRKGYGVLLKDSFESPTPEAQDYLNAFCLLEDDLSRRGLERHLSRRHGEERSDLKDRARYCVLSHQRRLKRDGMKQDDMQDQLSKIYQDISRAAKVFARRLAKADELVVQEGTNNELANAIVDDTEVVGEGGRRMERRMSNFSVQSGNSCDSFRLPPNSTTMVARSRSRGRPNPPSTVRRGGSGAPSTPAAPGGDYFAAIA